jgi:HK97 family phage prohead protease
MTHEYKTLPFELKATTDGRRLTGHVAIFNNIDAGGDIIAPGAFKQDLADFLANGFIGGLNHDWDEPIASIESAEEDGEGLLVTSSPIKMTPMGDKVLELSKGPKPVIKKLSIGYKTLAAKYLDTEDEVKAYWAGVGYTPTGTDVERSKQSVRLLTRLKTFEGSPVTVPMNELATIHGFKSLESKDFAEHSRKVATAGREMLEGVESFIERMQSRVDARLKDGRELSQANWNAFKDVYDQHMKACSQHKDMCDQMATILDRTKPKAKPDPEPKEEPKSDAVSASETAELQARFAELMYATMLA